MNNFPLLFHFPDLISSLTVCSHSTIRITSCDTLYRHYFCDNYPSTLPVCSSLCLFILSTQPTTLTCSAVEAGSDKRNLSDKITTLNIKTRCAADWLQTCTQLSGDSATRFNTSVTPSHFSPLCFPRINVNTRLLIFLRLSSGFFLSFPHSCITFAAFQVLIAVLLRVNCFLYANLCR